MLSNTLNRCHSRVSCQQPRSLRLVPSRPLHLHKQKTLFNTPLVKPQPLQLVTASTTATAALPLSLEQTEYQLKAKKLVTLVNDLRDVGAQFQFDLPCLVVCGNQSAGKSSLLERICGVKLPRAAGTCTKCPTEVRMSTNHAGGSDGTWRCQIKLRREYDKNNKQLDSKPDEEAFKTLAQADKDHLHLYISAAQRALLNPQTPTEDFVQQADDAVSEARSGRSSSSLDSGTEDTLAFTRNVIVLEITGADADLTLIDLPGIIQTEVNRDGSVELVKGLVQQYIRSDRAIIVATISCKDEIKNQEIVRMARDIDHEGNRTIGVLTKVDTIEAGTHSTWLPVLKGDKFPLRLGYYCVVNPSQEDINNNITPENAAAKEAAFFEQDPFFKDVTSMLDRYGVDALRLELSRQLTEVIKQELPAMKATLLKERKLTGQQLEQLPPVPSADPIRELLARLQALSRSLENAVHGRDEGAFFRSFKIRNKRFRKAVLAAHLNVGGEEPEVTLRSVRQQAEWCRLVELPTFAPYGVLEELVKGFKGRWEEAAHQCLEDVAEDLHALADKLVQGQFVQFPAAQRQIGDILYEMRTRLLADAKQQVEGLLSMEKEQTWTQNDEYFSTSKEKYLSQLVARQLLQANSEDASDEDDWYFDDEELDRFVELMGDAGVTLTAEDLKKAAAKNGQTVQAQDAGLLELIAGAQAYFEVSSKRVIDEVPMHLRHYLLLKFCKEVAELPLILQSSTEAEGSALQQAAQLMAEDESVAQRRAFLLRRQAQLLEFDRLLSAY